VTNAQIQRSENDQVDGSIRLYALPETKVHKAIRGLPDEVASLAFEKGAERNRYLWAASGRKVRIDLCLT
jgi:hypothetical protein